MVCQRNLPYALACISSQNILVFPLQCPEALIAPSHAPHRQAEEIDMSDSDLLEACLVVEQHILCSRSPEEARVLLPQYFPEPCPVPTNWSPITDSDSDICEESDPELREHLLFEQRENKHAYELLRTIHVEEQRRQFEEEALSAYIRANPWNPYLPNLPSDD